MGVSVRRGDSKLIIPWGKAAPIETPCDVAIGAFDALHMGHQTLFARLQQGQSAITLFNPVPGQVFRKDFLGCVASFAQRCTQAKLLGINYLIKIDFSEKFSTMVGEEFLTGLCRCVPIKKIVVGQDFCMGIHRSFTTEHLQQWGKERGIETQIVSLCKEAGQRIATQAIRKAIKNADFAQAEKWMGHAYALDLRRLPWVKKEQGVLIDLSKSMQVFPQAGYYEIEQGVVEMHETELILPCIIDQCIFKRKLI